ncbi:hypothetical protein GLOIN_2v1882420 [Rhizophagus clarus]|uniref:Uncharacterized protein n=1 Tax=Rhizophagus clarus TaxID=94130 RepID=A0A8H3QYI0_9GLOM|nr:hypothetical protein GLOIN_2v1882420 [Rhizophagus clarus]
MNLQTQDQMANLLTQKQMEPEEVTLTEIKNRFIEILFTRDPVIEIKRPGKKAFLDFIPKEPQPPKVQSVDIVVKLLDRVKFPAQSGKMLNDETETMRGRDQIT